MSCRWGTGEPRG